MKKYFIQTTNTSDLSKIATYFEENKFPFEIIGNNLIFNQNWKIEYKKQILKKCDELELTIFDGKPTKNFKNAILSFIG